MDIWVDVDLGNAKKVLNAVNRFGLVHPDLTVDVFMQSDRIFRIGHPPIRIEILTGVSGVKFENCHVDHIDDQLDGIPLSIINLRDLKTNKRAAGRHKDLNDLEHLP